MEDVCDLSHLLQTERHEKEELEKSLSEVDSSLDIENQRFKYGHCFAFYAVQF